MRRWLAAVAITSLSVVPVAADVTVTTSTTIEGGMAALAGAGVPAPKIVTQIKGNKSRTEIAIGAETMATVVDLANKQVLVLRHDQKTAQVIDTSGAVKAAGVTMPKVDIAVKPTSRKRDINGVSCDEYTVSMRMDMAQMAGRGNTPPEAAAMLQDMRMIMAGSVWVAKDAPGSAEYAAFQSGAGKLVLSAMSGAGQAMPQGMESAITGFSDAPGIPYLTEIVMSMEGSGKIVEMMKQMGDMKIITRVTAVSIEPLADTLFVVPEGYTIKK